MRTTTRLAVATASLVALSVLLGASSRSHTGAAATAAHRLAVSPLPSLGRKAGDGSPLVYHGGSVLHGSTTYALFWSPPGFTMPADYQAEITKFFQDQAAGSDSLSTAYAVVRQYFDTKGPVNPHTVFGGAIVAADPAPTNECTDTPREVPDVPVTLCVRERSLVRIVEHAAVAKGIAPGTSAIFFVFTPPGLASCWDDGVTCAYAPFEGYHNTTNSGYLFTVHPFFAKPRLDVISHEHIETLANPTGGGWYTEKTGQEIADLCVTGAELRGGTDNVDQVLAGTTYSLPTEWSNATGTCAASVAPPTTPLTVRVSGPGHGELRARFAGQTLTCKSTGQSGVCRTVVRRGAQVALKAAAEDGFIFTAWNAATPCASKKRTTCTFRVGASPASAAGSFIRLTHYLVSVDVTGRGALVWPDGKRCRTSCIESFKGGDRVSLRAVPDPGWRVDKLVDDTRSCGKSPRCTITLHDNDNVFVRFVPA